MLKKEAKVFHFRYKSLYLQHKQKVKNNNKLKI